MRRPPPLLLDRPTRFAGLARPPAIAALAAFAIVVLASLLALAAPSAEPTVAAGAPGSAPRQTDLMLYQQVVDGVRHGGGYYPVAADALRAGGYPLRPFVAFRLPTLAIVQAALPPVAVVAMLWALVAAVLAAWWRRLAPAFARAPGKAAAALLLLGGTIAFWQADLAPFHELWAGLFIALSLALRTRERWVEAVAFALAAMLVRETAALYALVMLALALAERRRAEAIGWVAALAVFGVAVGLHAHAVASVVRPLDPASPGWAGMLGIGFVVRAIATSTALGIAPLALAGPLLALALLGWAGWRDDLGLRMLSTIIAYAALIAAFSRVDTFYWALLVAPACLAGLGFAPDALRDLTTAALDRRRITVRRVTR